MPKLKRNIVTVLLCYLATLLLTSPANAQFNIEDKFLIRPGATVSSVFPTPGSLLTTILPNIYIIASIILMFILLGAGFTIVTRGDKPEQTQKGRQGITTAIIGFIIIFASYWIIQIIEIITGIPIFEAQIPGLN